MGIRIEARGERPRLKAPSPITLRLPHPFAMPSYSATFQPLPALSPADIKEMLALYESLYVLPDRAIFRADLAAKDEVLLLRRGQELVGFTTLHLYEFAFQGLPRRIVFSGDTVVHRDHWGQQALAAAWIRRMGRLHRRAPELPLYWFLVVKGHRTFRYLPAFCTRFHPHWELATAELKALADALALEHFGADYNPAAGVVRYRESRGHLSPAVAHPTPEELRLPAVKFFLEKNPGYLQGHELVCLFEFREEAMRAFTRRLFRAEE